MAPLKQEKTYSNLNTNVLDEADLQSSDDLTKAEAANAITLRGGCSADRSNSEEGSSDSSKSEAHFSL
jgi:hypothetical protein